MTDQATYWSWTVVFSDGRAYSGTARDSQNSGETVREEALGWVVRKWPDQKSEWRSWTVTRLSLEEYQAADSALLHDQVYGTRVKNSPATTTETKAPDSARFGMVIGTVALVIAVLSGLLPLPVIWMQSATQAIFLSLMLLGFSISRHGMWWKTGKVQMVSKGDVGG